MADTRLGDITRHDNGALFYGADLHVHSFGASDDVKDPAMTVEAIIDTAVRDGVQIVSVTDHNSARHVERSLDYGSKYADRLLVLPGVEITTANGHVLVYFAPEHAERVAMLLGRIELQGPQGGRDTHTAKSMADVVTEAERLAGLCVAAHIERPKMGFDAVIGGYPNAKRDIIGSSGLYGLEMDDVAHLKWYSLSDEPTAEGAARTQLLRMRETSSATAARVRLAAVQNSDAHTLRDFAAAHVQRAFTRLKMTSLGFDGVRTALTDPEARVRATSVLPVAVPRIIGFAMNGGFVDGIQLHLSPNLNAFIGGRGAGKSTAVKGIVYGLGIRDDLAEYDNCADNVVVYCENEAGVRFRYERVRGRDPQVRALKEGSKEVTEAPRDSFRVEYYGQGDLAEVSRDPLANAKGLQEFLDRHIALGDLHVRADAICTELRENSGQLRPLEASAALLKGKAEEVGKIDQKLKIAEESRIKDVAALQTRLGAEKELCKGVLETADLYGRGMSLANWRRDYAKLVEAAGQLTGREECRSGLEKVRSIFEQANAMLDAAQASVNADLKQRAQALREAIEELRAQHARLETEVNDRIAELQKKGLSGDLRELNALIQQRGSLARDVTRIQSEAAQLSELRQRRVVLLGELASVRTEITARRKRQITEINRSLKSTIDDYAVNLYYDEQGIAEQFERFVSDVMRGSYFQDQQVRAMCARVSPARFADVVHGGDAALISAECGVGEEWGPQLLRRFGELRVLHELELVDRPPRPVIKVLTKSTPSKQIPVNQLSDGQKHTILLTIAMLAESNWPLIIDQPEDDLDNAFIFKSVVSTLRNIKEKRQIILVTHNANIAVLGDSELIVPMRRVGEKGTPGDLGAIDNAPTRTAVLQVLEGGELAFQRRRAIYGY